MWIPSLVSWLLQGFPSKANVKFFPWLLHVFWIPLFILSPLLFPRWFLPAMASSSFVDSSRALACDASSTLGQTFLSPSLAELCALLVLLFAFTQHMSVNPSTTPSEVEELGSAGQIFWQKQIGPKCAPKLYWTFY